MGDGNFVACIAKVSAAPAQKREGTASAVDLAEGSSPPFGQPDPLSSVSRPVTSSVDLRRRPTRCWRN